MKTVTENNKLIAEFIGYVFRGKNTLEYNSKLHFDDSLKFHNNWHWLMEAVEKIESIEYEEDLFYDVIIGGFLECSVQDREGNIIVDTIVGQSKIEAVYNAVVSFIEWHNSAGKEN